MAHVSAVLIFFQTPGLTFLDARSCDINERLIPILGRALRMGCFLQILHLENTYLSGRALVILGKDTHDFLNFQGGPS